MSDYELVHTMTDYYDGPRGGIADYEGIPHIYQSMWSDSEDNYNDVFRLSPVGPDVFALALEDWQIWLRWETAFHQGNATQETHPALPNDRPRHEELQLFLKDKLAIDDNNVVLATADFRPRADSGWSGRGFHPLEVKWSLADR